MMLQHWFETQADKSGTMYVFSTVINTTCHDLVPSIVDHFEQLKVQSRLRSAIFDLELKSASHAYRLIHSPTTIDQDIFAHRINRDVLFVWRLQAGCQQETDLPPSNV